MSTSAPERAGSVEFRVLGNVEVEIDGQTLALEGRKSRELLAYLLLHANEPVPTDRIVDALWGDDAPLTVDASLRVAVSKLRKALEAVTARDRLETKASAYLLRVEPELIDASNFDGLTVAGRLALEDARWEEAAETFEEALALWRGTPYAELTTAAEAARERRRLESRRLDVQDDLTDAQLAIGRHESIIPDVEALVDEHPARERRAAQLMLALYRSGRQAEALDVYTRTRSALNADLGLEPGPELRELQQQVLQQDPALEALRGSAPAAPRHRSRWRLALIAAVVAAVIALGGTFAWSARDSAGSNAVPPPDSVAVVDQRDAQVAASAPTGRRPVEVVLGDGSAWVANAEEGTITQVDADSHQVIRTIGVGFEPTGVASGEGAVWVVGGYDHQLVRIDTSDGRVRLRIRLRERLGPLPAGYERGPAGVAVEGDEVWVSHGVELTRFDPRTGSVERTERAGGPWVSQVAVGEGFVWVASDGEITESGTLEPTAAIDAVSLDGDRRARVPLVGLASDIEVGDGSVWTTITLRDAVWRTDPSAMRVDATISAGDHPVALAIDNGVWVSNSAEATVTKLDSSTYAKLDVVEIGHRLEGIAAADGHVWVAVRSP